MLKKNPLLDDIGLIFTAITGTQEGQSIQSIIPYLYYVLIDKYNI